MRRTVLIALGAGLLAVFVAGIDNVTMNVYPSWVFWHGRMHLIRLWCESFGRSDPHALNEIPDGEFPLSNLPRENLDVIALRELLGDDLLDPWSRPFWGKRTEGGLSVYSMGEDGVSASGGSDEDDLNSWGQTGVEFYGRKFMRNMLLQEMGQVALAWLVIFPIALWVLGGSRKGDQCPSNGSSQT